MLPQENRENAEIASYALKKNPVESMTKCVHEIAAQKTDKKQRPKSCYFYMYHIGQFRKFLPRKTIGRAMRISRIDYCNALLYGTSGKNLVKLQRLQNVAGYRKIIVGG